MLCVPPPRSPSPPSFAPALPAARRQSPTSVVRLIIVFAHACMMKPSPSGARRRRLRHRVRVRASLRPAANAFFSAPSARRTGARGARCCEMRVCEDEGGSKRTSGCSHGRRRPQPARADPDSGPRRAHWGRADADLLECPLRGRRAQIRGRAPGFVPASAPRRSVLPLRRRRWCH